MDYRHATPLWQAIKDLKCEGDGPYLWRCAHCRGASWKPTHNINALNTRIYSHLDGVQGCLVSDISIYTSTKKTAYRLRRWIWKAPCGRKGKKPLTRGKAEKRGTDHCERHGCDPEKLEYIKEDQ